MDVEAYRGVVSRKRNQNKKAWARERKARQQAEPVGRKAPPAANPRLVRPRLPVPDEPTELDQVGVLIVEEQLGLSHTDLNGLRALGRNLPFEPALSLLAILAGHVEGAIGSASAQLRIAEEFFGRNELTSMYAALVAKDPKAYVFGSQSIHILMRVLIDEAYDAPITQELTDDERLTLMRAVIASNSVTERGTDNEVGPTGEDLLAYELQIGHYYSRPPWMEEMSRARELYRLATKDEGLKRSPDCVPVAEWVARTGIDAHEQWQMGFALASSANAWDVKKHPHIPLTVVDEILHLAGFADHRDVALDALATDRAGLRQAFRDLAAIDRRFMWELRPFNTFPLLRLQDGGGLLLLSRPAITSWLSDGFHYRAMRGAQADDAARQDGRTDHVQRYTAFAGQVFEQYCLRLAQHALADSGLVIGEQPYGKGGGQLTSDIAVLVDGDLVLFEANARRVGAEPLLTGDPQDATTELTKLLVKKINQLGVTIGALLAGEAKLPGIDVGNVSRIFPVVIAAGRLWQTSHLWSYLDGARDPDKCASFGDLRVQPLQALDGSDYEKVLALVQAGGHLGQLLGDKASGPFRQRDLAVWATGSALVTDREVRLPEVTARFKAMTDELAATFGLPSS